MEVCAQAISLGDLLDLRLELPSVTPPKTFAKPPTFHIFLVPKLHLGTGLFSKLCFIAIVAAGEAELPEQWHYQVQLGNEGQGRWRLDPRFTTQMALDIPASYPARNRGA